MKAERLRSGGSFLLLALPVLVLFGRALAGGATLYDRDIHTLFFGQTESFVRCVAAKSWPLWNPYLGFGQPMLANPGHQVLYPPTWLNFLVSVETYYALYAAGHVLFAGLGAYRLAGRFRYGRVGAWATACVFMLSGPLLSMVFLWQHLAGAAFIPWTLWAQERALQKRTRGAALAWGALVALQLLTGSVDMVLLGLIPSALLLARRLLRRRPGRRVATAFPTVGVAAVFAVGLTAALWLPAFDFLTTTTRTDQPEALRLFFSLHPLIVSQALVPLDLLALDLSPSTQLSLFGPVSPLLGSLYLGAVALPLALAGLRRGSAAPRAVLVILGLVGLVVSLGRYGLIVPWLQDLVPPLRIFRFPPKAMILCSLAFAMLAGGGLARWRPRDRAGASLRAVAGLGAAAPAGATLAILAGLLPTRGDLTVALPAALAAVLATTSALLIRRGAGSLARFGVLALATLDLTAANARVEPVVPREILARPPETIRFLGTSPLERVYSFEYNGRNPNRSYRRTLFAAPAIATPNPLGIDAARALGSNLALRGTIPARFGIYSSFGFDTLVVPTRERLRLTLLLLGAEETPGFRRLLRVGGVRHVLALDDVGLEDLTRIASIPTPYVRPLDVFTVPDPLPRAYVVGGVRVGDDDFAARTLLDPGFQPRREIVLPANPPLLPDPGTSGEVRRLDLGCDRVSAEVTLDGRGYLVLLDAYDPGWRATVDGAPAEVWRANLGFRAVPLEPGDHVVELAYRPRFVPGGLVVSATVLLLGLTTAVLSRRRAPPPRG